MKFTKNTRLRLMKPEGYLPKYQGESKANRSQGGESNKSLVEDKITLMEKRYSKGRDIWTGELLESK